MAINEEEFLKRLQAAFKIEAEEHLQAMSAGLLSLEQAATQAEQASLIESIYREAHSLKGAARAVNFTAIESICQSLESVFSVWKRGDGAPSPEAFDPLHHALDAIGQLTAESGEQASKSTVNPRIGLLAKQIDALARAPKISVPENAATSVARAAPGDSPAAGASSPGAASPVVSGPEGGAKSNGSSGNGATHHTGNNGGVRPTNGQHPPPNAAGGDPVESHAQPLDAQPPLNTQQPLHAQRSPLPQPVEIANREAPRAEVSQADASAETIRIATAKLDSLLRQAEEMVAVKLVEGQRALDLREIVAGLEQWKKEWGKVAPAAGALRAGNGAGNGNGVTMQRAAGAGAIAAGNGTASPAEAVLNFLDWNSDYLKELQERMAALSKSAERDRHTIGGLVDNLLDDSKKLLMLPFSTMLAIFPKLVRDVSRELGKDVELTMHGGEVEIDKRILEEMKAPLVHLVRNSIDHGLERPADRVHAGKTARGTIRIDVMQMGGQVEIVVADDGGGIDTTRVRSAAIAGGALAEEINALTEREAMGLIFRSDLTTSATVTELSGRGLGMAIAREKVEKLGGQITLETQPGHGTTFRIVLPLTLATFRGILVLVSGHIFVLPTAHVAMAARIKPETIQTAGNTETISHYGRAVSLVHLADILEMPRPAPTADSDFIPVIILGSGDQHIAFSVDEVLDEQEVLIKSLGKPLIRVRNVEGVTVLGTGRVVPVLNVSDLLRSARGGGVGAPQAYATAPTVAAMGAGAAIAAGGALDDQAATGQRGRRTVLVAEDSITSRMLLKNILEAAGYSVTTAVDGMDALTILRSGKFDLVVSDIDMPRLNGLDLTTSIRSDPRLSETPVVLVTARDSPEDRERGIDVGANAYVVKTSFDQSNLLDVVRRLV